MDARQIVKRVSAASDRLLARATGTTVLIYHRVGGGSDSDVDLTVDAFAEQLLHLRDHASVVTLDRAVADLVAGVDDGPKVVITFDDGTADFTQHAVPALVRAGLPATLFAATQFVDEQTDFPWGAPPASWTGLREAVSTGLVSVESHTHSHWLLDRLDPSAVADDLDRSIDLIGSNVGVAPVHFAYPKALPGAPAAEIAIRRRFRSAAVASSRVNRPGRTDVHRLRRTPVQCSDGFEHFVAKANGGMRLEGELRAMAARLKYRGAAR